MAGNSLVAVTKLAGKERRTDEELLNLFAQALGRAGCLLDSAIRSSQLGITISRGFSSLPFSPF
jgi:hypothetical protein